LRGILEYAFFKIEALNGLILETVLFYNEIPILWVAGEAPAGIVG
jgi:hypothetical protein